MRVRPHSTWSAADAEDVADVLGLPKGRIRIGPPEQRRTIALGSGSVLIAPGTALDAPDLDVLADVLRLPKGDEHEMRSPPDPG